MFKDSNWGSNTEIEKRSQSGALIKFADTTLKITRNAQNYASTTSTEAEYVFW